MAVGTDQKEFSSAKDAYQASLSNVKNQTNDLPSLVFVFSDEQIPPPPKAKNAGPKPSPQALDSADAWSELFQSEGDFSVFIPGRFFNIFRADASGVKDSDNRYLCSKKAPMVLLLDKNGEVKAVFEGKARIKRANVVDAMVDVLRKDGFIQNTIQFARLNALMTDLEKIELDLVLAKERGDRAQSTAADAKAKSDAKARKAEAKGREAKTSTLAMAAEENADKANDLIKSRNEAKAKILKEEYDLLAQLKLPASRMPSEPQQP